MVFIVLIFAPPTIKFVSRSFFSWNIFNDYLEKKGTDKSIVLIPFIQELSFKKNYTGRLPLVSLYFKKDNLSLEEKIVRYNWQLQNTTKEELYEWILSKTLNQNDIRQTQKDGINKIFLLNQRDKFKIIEDVLLENHWSLTNDNIFAGLDYNIIEFNAPNYKTTSTTSIPTN